MRKIRYFLVILSFLALINPVFAQTVEKLAIFPVDVAMQGTSVVLYPNTLNLIAGDIANALSKQPYLSVIDLNSAENIIKSQGLQKKYKKLLLEYKNSYTLDYDTLMLISKKLGATKVLLVSGGYDVQKLMMERGILYKLDVPTGKPLVPAYRLNIVLTLIDPVSGIIMWEDTYKKNFKTVDFPLPSQNFSENVISVEKLKKFSYEVASETTLKMANTFKTSAVTEINSNIVTTKENTEQGTNPTDGITTKDGHSFYDNVDQILNKRINNYKNWVKENIFNE